MGPHPAVAAVRGAVRAALDRYIAPGCPVVVACSGGADSVALAAAARFVTASGPGARTAVLVTVDHDLQAGARERAAAVVALGRRLGFDDARSVRVAVGSAGGPEAAARAERYAALSAVGREIGGATPAAVLLGHTLDDQAETVLLGLGRGSGLASLAAMRPVRDGWVRPLLGVRRQQTRRACAEQDLPVWDDPHNADPRYRRVRVRAELLPLMEDVLGGGVAEALARTAAQLQDADQAVAAAAAELARAAGRLDGLDAGRLLEAPAAVRARTLKLWAEAAGAAALTASHVAALDALVTRWRGQGPIDLPGGGRAERSSGTLRFVPPARRSGPTGQE